MLSISNSTIEPMLTVMGRFNDGEDVREELSVLLDHPDYTIELERYEKSSNGGGFTKEEFIEYFVNIRELDPDTIEPRSLRFRRDGLLYILDNLEHFWKVYEDIKTIGTNDVYEALEITHYGLPNDISIDDMNYIFSIGLGMSGGWIYQNYSQYDLKEVLDTSAGLSIKNTLAHESHHNGMNRIMSSISEKVLNDNLDGFIMLLLSGEGTAIKYCNNFEGKLTSKLNKDSDIDVVKQSYNYYMDNFEEIYALLQNDIRDLRAGKYSNLGEVEQLFMKHYFYTDVEIGGKMKANYLTQPVTYFLGADIWGFMHDKLGREKVFECVRHPERFIKNYDQAMIEADMNRLIL